HCSPILTCYPILTRVATMTPGLGPDDGGRRCLHGRLKLLQTDIAGRLRPENGRAPPPPGRCRVVFAGRIKGLYPGGPLTDANGPGKVTVMQPTGTECARAMPCPSPALGWKVWSNRRPTLLTTGEHRADNFQDRGGLPVVPACGVVPWDRGTRVKAPARP